MLPPDASQADVYSAAVKPIVEDVLNGYNGTVMAYGAPALAGLLWPQGAARHSNRRQGLSRRRNRMQTSAPVAPRRTASTAIPIPHRPVPAVCPRCPPGVRPRAGQTGAGKTFTLSSIKPDAIGMIPRAAAEVFAAIAADPAHEYSVALSYVQIYMELIQVLLRNILRFFIGRIRCVTHRESWFWGRERRRVSGGRSRQGAPGVEMRSRGRASSMTLLGYAFLC